MNRRHLINMCLGWAGGCGLAYLIFSSTLTDELARIGAVTLMVAALVGFAANMWDRLRSAWAGE